MRAVNVSGHQGVSEVLAEAMTALAAAAGAGVVQAATTDAWTVLRVRIAQWFGRGDGRREQVQLERLDRTAAELTASGGTERERELHEREWRTRFEDLLEGLDDTEREEAADELRALFKETAAGGVSAGDGSVAVGGSISVQARDGAIAAAVLNGGARIDHRPPMPDPSQG
ncbi:hypothetical protein OHA91_39335 (plasmid) [Streptomyces erythrochromogenes]|uniref:Uncharacterized protein n=1 Tax=Streptomyces erythrochromogenes TaxID=285574 RepID=A0ABZ1QQ92_9ACTN|nr:hypothetical protein [Streptomyces erythrochromogenes]